MNTVPYNEYLLVMPSGTCKGFNDLNLAKAYINLYYERKIDSDLSEDGYNDATEIGAEEPRRNIFTQLGVAEGKCEVYSIKSFIEKIEENLIFEQEKEEIISKLIQEKININIYEYSLDEILADVEVINMMETYGEPD